jgi:cytochrome c biogenesis protein CcmG/thiol:disulfide interchange protein DsbE
VGTIVGFLAAALLAGMALMPELKPIRPGSQAPDFTAVNLATGDTVQFVDFAGQVILLNIWATWCVPCEAEMPSIQRLHEALSDSGLKILAVSVDVDESDQVLEWVRDRNLTFDVFQDRTRRIEKLYQTTGVPESFVIDSSGVIVRWEIGDTDWNDAARRALFRRLLGLNERTNPTENIS